MHKLKLNSCEKNCLRMRLINFFKKHNLSLQDKVFVVATSGGPDSMALLDMLNNLKKKYHLQIISAHFDHQLRADSYQETQLIKQYCAQNNIEFVNKKWNKELQPQIGIEAAARKYRYAFLTEITKKRHGDYLLTAHHCDDLLENILLKFIRSGNPSEMNSLQAVGNMRDISLLRPLLGYEKAELRRYDQVNNISFIDDETNFKDDTMRNRLRHHVVPLLKKENPNIGENALRFSENINLLTDLVGKKFYEIKHPKLFLGVAYRLDKSELADLSKKEKLYYWQNFIWQKWHIRVNENLAGFNLIDYQDCFYLIKDNLKLVNKAFPIKIDKAFTFNGRAFVLTNNKKDLELIGDFYLSADKTFYAGPLKKGGKLPLKNGQHAKNKKEFAQAGIPINLRPYCLTIYANNAPVFVEKTYQNQVYTNIDKHYYIYALKK